MSSHYLFEGYRDKMLSITASTAAMLDGELLKTIQVPADANTPAYAQLRQALREVRNANRRRDTYMKRVFTVMPSKQDPKVLLIGVDPEESLENAGHPGEVYRGRVDNIDLNQAAVADSYVSDEFGMWLRSHAPVRDRNGKLVGVVVVEAPEGWVQAKMRPISVSGLLALVLAFGLTVPAVIFVSRRVTEPLRQVRDALDASGSRRPSPATCRTRYSTPFSSPAPLSN